LHAAACRKTQHSSDQSKKIKFFLKNVPKQQAHGGHVTQRRGNAASISDNS
jgi:hypothetical protein